METKETCSEEIKRINQNQALSMNVCMEMTGHMQKDQVNQGRQKGGLGKGCPDMIQVYTRDETFLDTWVYLIV